MCMIHYPERYTPSRSEYNKIPNLDHRRDIRPTPTAEDAARLRRIVRRCNTEIIAELRRQYERLAAIDCLKR